MQTETQSIGARSGVVSCVDEGRLTDIREAMLRRLQALSFDPGIKNLEPAWKALGEPVEERFR